MRYSVLISLWVGKNDGLVSNTEPTKSRDLDNLTGLRCNICVTRAVHA